MKKLLKLPKFKNEDQEREFWSKMNLSDYFESSDFQPVYFPDLKPTSQPISLRLPKYLLNRLREKANFLSVPYQTLIKTVLSDFLTRPHLGV